jgi:hypothetical protein
MTRAGLCLLLPTVAFFAWHPYRSTTYLAPVAPVFLLMVANFPRIETALQTLFASYKICLGLLWLGLAVFFALQLYIIDGRSWFSLADLALLGVGVSVLGWYLLWLKTNWARIFATSFVGSALVLFLAMRIGEAEVRGLASTRIAGNQRIGYFDLQRNIWSEWAQLSVFLGRPVEHLRTPADVRALLAAGGVVIVPGGKFIGIARSLVETGDEELLLEPWRRWVVGGPGVDMKALWLKLWQTRQSSVLMTDFYALSFEGSRETSFAVRH